MASFTALYTKPDDAEGFLKEYTNDHVPIAARWPKVQSATTTVFSGTPRRTEAAYYVMFHATWASKEDMMEAMADPSLMEASKHAMGMLQKYGNSAEMLIGEDA